MFLQYFSFLPPLSPISANDPRVCEAPSEAGI